jgi:hypothetical protein
MCAAETRETMERLQQELGLTKDVLTKGTRTRKVGTAATCPESLLGLVSSVSQPVAVSVPVVDDVGRSMPA